MTTSSKDALLKRNKVIGKLYDSESMLAINLSVASGFVILLGGVEVAKGKKSHRKKDADISLGFLALTQGNVLDACFGVVNPSRREDTPATRSAREGKELLDDAALVSDSIRGIAVEAYCEAFRVSMHYSEKMGRLNCISRCFKSKKIRCKAEKSLRAALIGLAEAIADIIDVAEAMGEPN
jgi:hypothetical protein